ncbi:MAG TPA: hypothetical protein VF333_02135, partial [Pyrinomonadaceae bacterium]
MRLAALGLAYVTLLSLQIACTQKELKDAPPVSTQSPAAAQSPVAGQSPVIQSENYPTLVAQAQEVNDAFRRRDFARMVDLTYPKVIEAA